MSGLRATVKNGRIVLDEATALPEGTVLHLVLEDEGDNLGPVERAARRAAILEGFAEAKAGDVIPAEDVLAELRLRR
jgi:hypothetical protein